MNNTKNILETLQLVSNACHYLLSSGASYDAQQYIDLRISKESQKKFQLGYYPSVDNLNLLTDSINKDDLYNAGLLFSKPIEDSLFPRFIDFSYFENYPIVLPYKDVYGRIQGIVGRTLYDKNMQSHLKISKYKNTNSFHKSQHLFGLFENKLEIEKKGFVYIVEGQFDVIKACEAGINNIVAAGSCNLSGAQLSLIKRYTNNIYILFDNDGVNGPGEQARIKIKNKYSKFANIKNAYIPKQYKDLDEYIIKLNGKLPEIQVSL